MVQQLEGTGGQRPTFLTLRDHGKVYVADLPRLSDGQLTHIHKEAQDVFDSLNRRLQELEAQIALSEADQDTRIRATTKRDITQRFLNSIAQEQELRRSNPALRAAAGESLARAFLELARHRLLVPPSIPCCRRPSAPAAPVKMLPSAAKQPTPRWCGCSSGPRPPSHGRRPCPWC